MGMCYTGKKSTQRGLVGKSERKRPTGRPTRKGDDNIKNGLQAAGW